MQSSGSNRASQRRSPAPPPGPPALSEPMPPAPPAPSSSQHSNSGSRVRSSSGSGKSKKRDPATQLSQIEKSVTHLLIATKQLLETLTQWSRHKATEGEVSDVYVRLGYEFNIACRAFTSIGVPTDDLGPVPDLLRGILEETLSQEASPQSLDQFLPKIRDIIINLLHGLKKKQSKLRASKAKDGSIGSSLPAPQEAPGDEGSFGGDVQNLNRSSQRVPERRGTGSERNGQTGDEDAPHRASSTYAAPAESILDEPLDLPPDAYETPSARDSLRRRPASGFRKSRPVEPSQTAISAPSQEENASFGRSVEEEEFPTPPPAPRQPDAIAQLQRGGELERRASKRFSTYQISKHLGAAAPMLPPAQNSPIPNRGRDVRESLHAVRTRGSYLPPKPSRPAEGSPYEGQGAPGSTSNGDYFPNHSSENYNAEPASSGTPKQSETKKAEERAPEQVKLSATVNGPPNDTYPQYDSPVTPNEPPVRIPAKEEVVSPQPTESETPQFVPEQSPQPGKELTLFLQYKSKIKKFVLPDGSNELSIARLQLAFIEKFAWNTQNNGNDLPEIYIQDSVSGVRHELEDLSDIKDRSVLVLNVEALDEVKKQIDEGFDGLKKMVENIKSVVDGQQLSISQVSERQIDAAKEISRIASTPAPASAAARPQPTVTSTSPRATVTIDGDSRAELQSLRRDLAIMRQTFSSFKTGISSSISSIRAKADEVKSKASEAAIPALEGDTGRSYVNAGKKSVGEDSEDIVGRVDDLQDRVEDLRKDVVTRGVRPLMRQLESVNNDIVEANKDLKRMQAYVKREKPIWTKIWEKELDTVCNDREFLTMQEDLIADLEDDLEKATQTMKLVEQATKQQTLDAPPTGQPPALRSISHNVPFIDPDVDPRKAKDGVLGEVRALQPNHEGRLEAIERAEKARLRELESRRENAAFKKELGSFVEEGKLKKSGGIDAIEKQRQAKEERALFEEHDAIQIIKAERKKARAEQKAREAREAEEAAQNGEGEGQDDFMDQFDPGASGGGGGQEGEDLEGEANGHKVDGPSSPSKRGSWLPAIFSS